jgi:hypothetical protein
VVKREQVRVGDYSFFYAKRNENNQLKTGFFVHHKIVSAIKTVEVIGNITLSYHIMAYIDMRGRWCIIIVLNVHVPREEKIVIQKTVL